MLFKVGDDELLEMQNDRCKDQTDQATKCK